MVNGTDIGAAILPGCGDAAGRRRILAAAGGLLLLAAAPLVLYPVFIMKVMCFALFAAAFNLLLGYVGLLSFGHAAFFGSAAYVAAVAMKNLNAPPELAVLAGTAVAALLGALVGLLAIRRTGIYFAMITMALSQLVYFVCLQHQATHGEDGIQAVPRGLLFGLVPLNDNLTLYGFVSVIFVAALYAMWRIVHSPFGNILAAIRENEQRVASLGYRVERYKLGAFVLSAAFTGLAGATKVLVFQLASLTDVTWQMSGEPVLMTVLGGAGTFFGPVVGAAVVLSFEHFLSDVKLPYPVLIGLIFMACVLFFRRGIWGGIKGRLGLA